MSNSKVLFVHGILSSAKAWKPLVDELGKPEYDTAGWELDYTFQYASPKFSWSPLKRIPELTDMALRLKARLEDDPGCQAADRIVLVGHSQGGLVIQRFLAETLRAGEAHELSRIRGVVLLATPNQGSELLLSLRRGLGRLFRRWITPQEKALRPFDEEVMQATGIVLTQVVQARYLTDTTCPIPFHVYAGESDGIVPLASAQGAFPDAKSLPGDHNSLLKPSAGNDLGNAAVNALGVARKSEIPTAVQANIAVQPLGPDNAADVGAAYKLLADHFGPGAAVKKNTFVHWLTNYEKDWGQKLRVYTARLAGTAVGCLMYHLFDESVAVLDYLVAETGDGASDVAASMLVAEELVGALQRDLDDAGVTDVIFEVEDPAALPEDRQTRAKARIRLFQRRGAGLIDGVSYHAVDMDEFPTHGTEQRYRLMYRRNGLMPEHLSRAKVQGFLDVLYKQWYGNWLKHMHADDAARLDAYLDDVRARVAATVLGNCRLDR